MYYHVWFVTKYRKPTLCGYAEEIVKNIFAECIDRKGYEILEYEGNKNHMHLLIKVSNKSELSAIARTLKCVSAKKINGYHRHEPVEGAFWAKKYGYKEVTSKALPIVREYIRNQKEIQHV